MDQLEFVLTGLCSPHVLTKTEQKANVINTIGVSSLVYKRDCHSGSPATVHCNGHVMLFHYDKAHPILQLVFVMAASLAAWNNECKMGLACLSGMWWWTLVLSLQDSSSPSLAFFPPHSHPGSRSPMSLRWPQRQKHNDNDKDSSKTRVVKRAAEGRRGVGVAHLNGASAASGGSQAAKQTVCGGLALQHGQPQLEPVTKDTRHHNGNLTAFSPLKELGEYLIIVKLFTWSQILEMFKV